MARSKCLILSAHDGLIDRRIIAQANTLAASQREVTLVSVPAEGRDSLLPQVRVIMADPAAPAGRAGTQTLRRMARHLPSPVKSTVRSLAWHMGAAPLRRFTEYFDAMIPRESYHVIHCHDLQTLPAGQEARARFAAAARVIYDSHEIFPYQFPPGRRRRYWIRVETQHIGHADAVLTVNESLADALADGYGISRPLVLYNSCHLEVRPVSQRKFHEHFGLPPGAPPHGFSILFQGGFVREKNVESLVRAFGLLGSDYRLFLLGGGPMETGLRKIARRQAPGNVYFGSWVRGEELLGYVARADAGIIPYLDDGLPNNHYCTPNKLFEYLQAGVPVCAGDLPELRRIVEGERLGRVYTMRTAADIAGAIADLSPRCRAGEFRARDFSAARDKYSWSSQARKLLNLYQQLGV